MMKRIVKMMAMGLLMGSFMMTSVSAQQFSGGWELTENITLTKEAQDAFDKATEELTGVDYTPVALLGTQIVAGTNYSILCKAKGVYPDAEEYYAILYIYEDLEGSAQILRIQDLDLSADEPTEDETVTDEPATDENAEEYSISICSGADLIVSCPESAKEGETVQIETFFVSDATLSVEVEDAPGYFVSEGLYEFVMPGHDVIVDADLEFDQTGAVYEIVPEGWEQIRTPEGRDRDGQSGKKLTPNKSIALSSACYGGAEAETVEAETADAEK